MSGVTLLDEFRKHQSDTAFSALVRQYSALIFSAARRRVSDPAMAEEVAQSVFIRLAKAPPRVATDAELVGWLHRTTLHLSIDQWRSESRRRAREDLATTMLTSQTEPDPDVLWSELAPHLDEAVDDLPVHDREAVLLRFFERRSMRELGEHLGVSEAAAKMRIGRALEKLRQTLASKGIVCGSALLGSTLAERVMEPVSETLIRRWTSNFTAPHPSGGAPMIPAASGTLTAILSSLTGAKLAMAIAGLLVAGWGISRLTHRPESPADDLGQPGASGAVVAPGEAGFGRAVNRRTSGPGTAASTEDLDEARRLLRDALQSPLSARSYPPTTLLTALSRFGDQLPETIPILVEAAGVPDYETRVWAFSGIQYVLQRLRTQDSASAYGDALDLVRPVLGPTLLESGRAGGMLKMMALGSLVQRPITMNGAPFNPTPTDPESLSWISRALHATPRPGRDDGFRFTIIDHFRNPRELDEQEREIIQSLLPMLTAKSPEDRLLAAYALAVLPGDKPSTVKGELLKAIRERSTESYRAALALGFLGADAVDTVSELLEFAKNTREWANGGYAEAALESACRLQPDLRATYPDVDKKLKLEEQAQENMIHPKGFREQILEWAAGGDGIVIRALTSSIQHDRDNESAERNREGLTRALDAEIAKAPADERIVLERVLELVRQADLRPETNEEESVPQLTVDIRNLVLDARIVLADTRNPNEDRIQKALENFQSEQVDSGKFSTVTPESFAAMARVLDDIDPQFRIAWHKAVLEENPRLDRVIPRAKP